VHGELKECLNWSVVKSLAKASTAVIVCGMRDLLLLITHLIITTIRIAPGGACAAIAESLFLKQQLLVLSRSRKKASRLRALDRVLFFQLSSLRPTNFPSVSVPIMLRYSAFIVGERICEFWTSRKSVPFVFALVRSSSGSSEPFGASISTRPSSGTASIFVGSWIYSPPITTSDVSMPDWVDRHPSSDAAPLCFNRRLYMTSFGNPTVPASSTRQSLRKPMLIVILRAPADGPLTSDRL
jgi:hypothetical protein